MVVSEMGEAWSPQTAPERIAATETTRMSGAVCPRTAMAIGMRMPNVPQLVPVAKASPAATRKKSGGRNMTTPALAVTIVPTKPPRLRYSLLQIPESVHARQRMKMAGVIALNPQPKLSQNTLNETTRRGR